MSSIFKLVSSIREDIVLGNSFSEEYLLSIFDILKKDFLSEKTDAKSAWKVMFKHQANLYLSGYLYSIPVIAKQAELVSFIIQNAKKEIGYDQYLQWVDAQFKSYNFNIAHTLLGLSQLFKAYNNFIDLPLLVDFKKSLFATCSRTLGDIQVSILREYLEAYDQSNKLESKELQPFPKVNTYDCEFNEDAFTLERKIDIRMLRRRLFRLKNKVISSFDPDKLITESPFSDVIFEYIKCVSSASIPTTSNLESLNQLCQIQKIYEEIFELISSSDCDNELKAVCLVWIYNIKICLSQYQLQDCDSWSLIEHFISVKKLKHLFIESNLSSSFKNCLTELILYSSRQYQFNKSFSFFNQIYYSKIIDSSFYKYTTGHSSVQSSSLDYLLTSISGNDGHNDYLSASHLAKQIAQENKSKSNIITVYCSYKYYHLVASWLKPHIEMQTLDQVVFIALDRKAFNQLVRDYGNTIRIYMWNIFQGQVNTFDVLFRHRMYLMSHLVLNNVNTFMSGLDSLWFKPTNILEFCNSNSILTFASLSGFNGDFIYIKSDKLGRIFSNLCLVYAAQGCIDQEAIGLSLDAIYGNQMQNINRSTSTDQDKINVTMNKKDNFSITILKRNLATRMVRYINNKTIMVQPAIRSVSGLTKSLILNSLYNASDLSYEVDEHSIASTLNSYFSQKA